MFKILKFVIGIAVFAIVASIVIYFLPTNVKMKVFEAVAGVVPDSIKDEAESLLLTPPQQRAKLIKKAEQNLASLKTNTDPKPEQLVTDTETILTQLKEKNEAQSLTEIVKEKLVDQLIGKTGQQNCAVPSTAPTL